MKDSNLAVKESLTAVALDHSGEATDMVAEQAEPVAWLYDWDHEGEIVTGWVTQDFETTKFNNGHNVRPLYAAPLRTKDLTVSELDAIIEKHYDDEMDLKAMILDGIAADRKKNRA